jgi:hypothetical protein
MIVGLTSLHELENPLFVSSGAPASPALPTFGIPTDVVVAPRASTRAGVGCLDIGQPRDRRHPMTAPH